MGIKKGYANWNKWIIVGRRMLCGITDPYFLRRLVPYSRCFSMVDWKYCLLTILKQSIPNKT